MLRDRSFLHSQYERILDASLAILDLLFGNAAEVEVPIAYQDHVHRNYPLVLADGSLEYGSGN
jgi:hypothetical protein